MKVGNPLTPHRRRELMRAAAQARLVRSGDGCDWQITSRWQPQGMGPSTIHNRSGNPVGKVRVSSKHVALLLAEGVLTAGKDGQWSLTAKGQAELDGRGEGSAA